MNKFLVGGAVRDKLLGLTPKDNDFVVVGSTVDEMLSLGFQQVGADFPVFLHPKTGEEFALARTERKNGKGYNGFICETEDVTLKEDLSRRDLTINAMAEDMNGAVIDPFGGQRDLEKGILRHVSPAFAEDPLRVLRVARFQARYKFIVADETQRMMSKLVESGELNNLTKERVWAETEKAMGEPHPEEFFRCLFRVGAMKVLFPEMNVLEAVLMMRDARTNDPAGMFAAGVCHLNPEVVKEMCVRLKVPTNWSQVAVCLSNIVRANKNMMDDAETVMQLFERTDAIRKPVPFLTAVRADPMDTMPSPHFVDLALDAMNSEEVKVTPEEVASVPREKIGELKRQKRVALLEKLLVQCGV